MRGVRAKLLREQAKKMTVGRPARKQVVVDLPPRSIWVNVPDDSGGLMVKLRNRFLHALGIPVPMKREQRTYTPRIIREREGTTRWAYLQLKKMYYRLRMA